MDCGTTYPESLVNLDRAVMGGPHAAVPEQALQHFWLVPAKLGRVVIAAGLQHHHRKPGFGQLFGCYGATSSRSNDADIGSLALVPFKVFPSCDHPSTPMPRLPNALSVPLAQPGCSIPERPGPSRLERAGAASRNGYRPRYGCRLPGSLATVL